MFAYCNNNPISESDPTGKLAVTVSIRNAVLVIPLLDGPSPFADIAAVIGFVGFLLLYDHVQYEMPETQISSGDIDWESGDKNHILTGTKRKHKSGWNRLGIDPNNYNSWNTLLPFLKEVVDEYDDANQYILPDGSTIVKFFKTYANEGVKVMVKIWIDVSEGIVKLSDAIPYIID